jgi:hypothetical protein
VTTAVASAFFPIPMYTTVPNEGSTYGFMPVFLSASESGDVQSILAPSVSWNSAAGVNTTFRYYAYPTPTRDLMVIAAASTHVNRTLWLRWYEHPYDTGRFTLDATGIARRNLFYRFFGLGPDTRQEDESSYTRTTAFADVRAGRNLPGHVNAGVRVIVRGDRPQRHTIFGLPALQDAHPEAPGLAGDGLGAAGAYVRYDSRGPGAEYSASGLFAELAGSYQHELGEGTGFGHIWRVIADLRALGEETGFTQTAGRVYWTDETGGPTVPFYYQSSLGGEVLLRGYPEDRFIDRGAWTVELEQRFRLFQTHIFKAVSDWRIDPFVTAGQVYGRFADLVSHVRFTAGIGLRAWVHPNVLGRVDIAYTDEGLRAYIVLGYPY